MLTPRQRPNVPPMLEKKVSGVIDKVSVIVV